MQKTPAAQRAVGLGLGAVVLALFVVLGILLPKAEGDTGTVSLPETLAGGWTATDALEPGDFPEEMTQDPAEVIKAQGVARDYVEKTYDQVYDEAPAYRVYADNSLERVALVTVFNSGDGSFGPPDGVIDPEAAGYAKAPVELVRHDDALCAVAYQATQAGQDPGAPTSITCQQAAGERTVQLYMQGADLDATYELLDTLVTDVV